jgi:hypothetical protein
MTEKIIEPKSVAVEASLLNAMMDRQHYNQYASYIDYKRVLPPTALLLEDYKKYYELYPDHEYINKELFYTQFCQHWHQSDLNEQDIIYFRDHVLPSVYAVEAKDVDSCLLGFIEKQTTEELIKSTKSFNLEKLRNILDYHEKQRNNIIKLCDTEITTISNVDFSVLDKTNGIPWWLPTLQQGIGSLVKGQLVLFSADFGTGKSAAVISQVAHTLEFMTGREYGPILYFNSEGTSADVFGRICSNVLRSEFTEGFEAVVANYATAQKMFLDKYGDDKLFVVQMMTSSVPWVTNKVLKYKPSLVIIDIADTLAKEEDVQSLKKVFDQLRVLSGSTCPIIATTQAGNQSYTDKETGEEKNRRWLSDKALYGSKTGKGGAADTIITIGKDNNKSNLRYISVPKKKRGKSVDITCQLIEEYSLYDELSW